MKIVIDYKIDSSKAAITANGELSDNGSTLTPKSGKLDIGCSAEVGPVNGTISIELSATEMLTLMGNASTREIMAAMLAKGETQ